MAQAARRWTFRVAIVFALVVLGTLITGAVAFGAGPDGQASAITEEARDMKHLYWLVLGMGALVFFLVESALLFILLRYRRRSDELPPQIHGNNAVEVLWTSIPVVIVIILFVFSFIVLVRVDEDAEPQDLTVDVQGFQFSWQFTYKLNDLGPGSDPNREGEVVILGTASKIPELYIPVDEPVEFTLHSNDVIHSFYVRNFLYKLDVVPGRHNAFKITATNTGIFEGQCAELCGLNHADMLFRVHVVTRAEFDQFIASQTSANAQASTINR